MSDAKIDIPNWATELKRLGAALASRPTAEFGQSAQRVFVSVPTGQYVPWLLAAGALEAPLRPCPIPAHGQRVTVSLGSEIVDREVVVDGSGVAQIYNQDRNLLFTPAGVDWFGAILPESAPYDRPQRHLSKEYRAEIRQAYGKDLALRKFVNQCASPVVIIGDGREYLQNQRRELLTTVPHWFDPKVRFLLDEDVGNTSRPERFFQYPFMVLSPELSKNETWYREIVPRLVIITRWSYYAARMHESLFSRACLVILANRRVESSYDGANYLDSDLAGNGRPGVAINSPSGSFFYKTFTRLAVRPTNDDEDDDL